MNQLDDTFPAWPPATKEVGACLMDVVGEAVWSDANGPRKTRFQQEFARAHDARYGLAVSTGTVALEIAVACLGIGSGDEVIVPAYTFLASATCVLAVNALPVFVDVDPAIGCIDPAAAEAAITGRTKAIIAVHLGGHPADLDALSTIVRRHGIALIEDAAHAHGARWRNRGVGSYGAFGTWSFQASKNMTAGEGGILVTNDLSLWDAAWSRHHCGRSRDGAWYEHGVYGGNHRMTEFQAAMLQMQLERLRDDVAVREQAAAVLDKGLPLIPGLHPLRRDSRVSAHSWHLYQFRYQAEGFGGLPRQAFVDALVAEGIPASAGYGRTLDRQPVFAEQRFDRVATGYDPAYPPTQYGRLHLPAAQALCDELVWLPHRVLLAGTRGAELVIDAAERIYQARANHAATASWAPNDS